MENNLTTLAETLPEAEFTEHHSLVIAAQPSQVWSALHDTRWNDLRLTRPLVRARGLHTTHSPQATLLDSGGPVRVVYSDPPRYVAGVRVARPWKLTPEPGPTVTTLDQLAALTDGSWLKYGMDFRLHPLPDGRTRLETTTLCQPTDTRARRSFHRYWRLIRPFSGLIRRDILNTVRRRAEASPAHTPTNTATAAATFHDMNTAPSRPRSDQRKPAADRPPPTTSEL